MRTIAEERILQLSNDLAEGIRGTGSRWEWMMVAAYWRDSEDRHIEALNEFQYQVMDLACHALDYRIECK